MKRRFMSVAIAAVAALGAPIIAMPAASAGGGNSADAHACQHGGWRNWVREDGTAFKNTGDCVSYAARGGMLTSPRFATTRQLCASFGGTFTVVDSGDVLWRCNGASSVDELGTRCFADGGDAFGIANLPNGRYSSVCNDLI
jgi:hypothetical protein